MVSVESWQIFIFTNILVNKINRSENKAYCSVTEKKLCRASMGKEQGFHNKVN